MAIEDDNSSSEDSAQEGLWLLTGLKAAEMIAWENDEEVPSQVCAANAGASNSTALNTPLDGELGKRERKNKVRLFQVDDLDAEDQSYCCYERSFHCTPSGQLARPPVRIVDLSFLNNRGNGLVATRRIPGGQVIFTEEAVEATQIPRLCDYCCRQNNKEITGPWSSPGALVRACQFCFRSLEPISCLQSFGDMPSPNLWPVQEYQDTAANDDANDSGCRTDAHGRMQCLKYHAIFCSKVCKDKHESRMGSCCACTSSVNAVVHAMHSSQQESLEDDVLDIQPAVVLAVRLFCSLLNRYRTTDKAVGLGQFDGMCGTADDVTPLELGCPKREGVSNECSYSLDPAYKALCRTSNVTMEEQNQFSLEFLHRLAAISARNGFAVTTQSPFRSYYAALLRTTGGRGTDKHIAAMKQVASALGSQDGVLHREMDRQIDEQCAVQVVALFTLIARINHSCDPCAEVRNQEFVDCRVDLVAKRDIEAGEEITISYINVGRTAGKAALDRTRRMRELQAKYLFTCDCERCKNNC